MEARLIKKFLLFACLFLAFSLRGEVYWLRDLGQSLKMSQSKLSDIERILDKTVFMRDPLIINGYKTEMEIASSSYRFGDLLREFNRIDARLLTILDGRNLIFTIELNDKYVQKYLISNIGNAFNATIFSMKLPKILPKPKWNGNWETILASGGAELERVIEYPERNATYITLKNVGNPELELDYIRQNLKSRGFKNFSNNGNELRSKSELFFKESNGEMIALSFDDVGNGFFYHRGEKK